MTRYCLYDDQTVREMTKADKEWGNGIVEEGFVHTGSSDGIPNCGRRVLTEDQTYTEGESDNNPPSGI